MVDLNREYTKPPRPEIWSLRLEAKAKDYYDCMKADTAVVSVKAG